MDHWGGEEREGVCDSSHILKGHHQYVSLIYSISSNFMKGNCDVLYTEGLTVNCIDFIVFVLAPVGTIICRIIPHNARTFQQKYWVFRVRSPYPSPLVVSLPFFIPSLNDTLKHQIFLGFRKWKNPRCWNWAQNLKYGENATEESLEYCILW